MKTIGLLAGMSWTSSVTYYRLINEAVARRLGGLHSARCAIYSVDFAPLEALMTQQDWTQIGRQLGDCAAAVQQAGAELLLICTNTMHKVADAVQAAVDIPLLHIADATARHIIEQRITTVGLLGTRPTMEDDFYRGRLEDRHHLKVITPAADQRRQVHDIIFNELCRGDIRADSRKAYAAIIDDLARNGAQAVILGCTEIGLLIGPDDSPVPLFDTTELHAKAAVDMALAQNPGPDIRKA